MSVPSPSGPFGRRRKGKRVPPSEAQLARVAARQHSVFTRAQSVAAGISARTIDRRLASGRWARLYAGIYISASVPVTWKQRLAGACLACGPCAFASHRSAVTVWGFADDLFAPAVTVPAGTRRQHDGIDVHETHVIERCGHGGFMVTTPMRTLLDAAGCVGEDRVVRMLDDALRRRLVHLEAMATYLDRPEHRSRPGSQTLRRMVAARTPERPIASDAETVLFEILRDAGLPLPVPQFPIDTRRGRKYIDFAYPDAKLAIEVDGWEVHGTRAAFENDRARQNEIEVIGYHVLRFTWTQVTSRPVEVALTVGPALGFRPTRWRRR